MTHQADKLDPVSGERAGKAVSLPPWNNLPQAVRTAGTEEGMSWLSPLGADAALAIYNAMREAMPRSTLIEPAPVAGGELEELVERCEATVARTTESLAKPDWRPMRSHVEALRNELRAALAALRRPETDKAGVRVPVEWREETRLKKWADWIKDQSIEGALLGAVTRLSDDLHEIAAKMAEFRAALAASPPPAETESQKHIVGGGVVVRGLEWERIEGSDLRGGETFVAETILGRYQVWGDGAWSDPHNFHSPVPGFPAGHWNSRSGKAAATGHYEARIRSALVAPEGAEEVEAIAELYGREIAARLQAPEWRDMTVLIVKHAIDHALRTRPIDTGKARVREAALEEAAKVADEVAELWGDAGSAAFEAANRIRALSASPPEGEQEPVVGGHCENAKKPGGCPLHNLQCGWPDCDRQPATPKSETANG